MGAAVAKIVRFAGRNANRDLYKRREDFSNVRGHGQATELSGEGQKLRSVANQGRET